MPYRNVGTWDTAIDTLIFLMYSGRHQAKLHYRRGPWFFRPPLT